MSRTYRRTCKGQKRAWLPEIWWKKHYFILYPRDKDGERAEEWCRKHPHRRKDINDYFHWLDNEPWWWRHDYHTVPRRAKTRALIQKVKNDSVDVEDVVFPLHNRPRIYYW